MRIAIIGAGIAGLTTAYLLSDEHDIVVYEANDYIGGHTHTIDVSVQDSTYAVDTGFIVFNDYVGASPDALIKEEDAGLEIKCPMKSRIHLSYIHDNIVPADYQWQVQCCIYVTGADWWDFISYDPRCTDNLKLFYENYLQHLHL